MILVKKSVYIPDKGEVLDNTRITDSAGYVPAKQRIEEMIAAGQRLIDYRRGRYDFPPEVSDDEALLFEDPTRRPNFDVVDAVDLAEGAVARIKASAAEKKRIAEAEKAKNQQSQIPEVKEPKGD